MFVHYHYNLSTSKLIRKIIACTMSIVQLKREKENLIPQWEWAPVNIR